ncbi:6124_t:CDS:2 [Dentiscutata erythropus]|uniref:6124_t:CDS:1 n=1 Tax=Dentiscutata erythropus TaxID=1348616 RepID=A0A9N8VBG1_9GLOM|nr:6124_t:CDS:2 [Dentiscutata erythropus]
MNFAPHRNSKLYTRSNARKPPINLKQPNSKYYEQPNSKYYEQPNSKVFKFFGSIKYWDGYACLFFVVWNNDPDFHNALDEFNYESAIIQNEIENIVSNGGYEERCDFIRKYFIDYFQSINSKNDELKNKVMKEIINYLHDNHSLPSLSQFDIGNIYRMDPSQRHLLRLICIYGIQAWKYAHYANYISSYQCMTHIKSKFMPGSYPNLQKQMMFLEKKNRELTNEIEALKSEKENSWKTKQSSKLSFGRSSQDEVNNLLQENERLREEAAKHQAALGNAMNFSWKDDDPNHSSQLMKEIDHLQHELSTFTSVKGSKISKIKIHTQAVNELFKKYKCSITSDDPQMKLILGAVLQRHAFEFIHQEILNYFEDQHGNSFYENSNLPNDLLEVGIIKKTKDLISLTRRFSEVNRGNDDYTCILPIKIRQQIYAALSNRGFTNQDHPLIQKIAKDLLELMDRYRTIESKEKNIQLQSKAKDIVYKIMNLFHLRIHTQKLPPEVLFYEGGEIFDVEIMDEIASLEDSEECDIEICAFPAVAIMMNDIIDNYSYDRVITRAQVILRPRADNLY